MPFERAAEEIIASYRELERILRDAPDGSGEAARLKSRMEDLRTEYLALGREAEQSDHPLVPTTWPDDRGSDEPASPE